MKMTVVLFLWKATYGGSGALEIVVKFGAYTQECAERFSERFAKQHGLTLYSLECVRGLSEEEVRRRILLRD